jgi:hypothetical protein
MLLAACHGPLLAATDLTVRTSRRGSAVEVDARATLQAPLDLIWQTLTDYDRLPEFVPGINQSRLIEYRGTAAIVEQHGEAGLFWFKVPINVVVESLELAPYVIEVRVLKGNLKQLDGRYRIEAGADPRAPLVLTWSGLIEPERPLPPLIGELVMRANVTDQFRGMVEEIERRQARREAATR